MSGETTAQNLVNFITVVASRYQAYLCHESLYSENDFIEKLMDLCRKNQIESLDRPTSAEFKALISKQPTTSLLNCQQLLADSLTLTLNSNLCIHQDGDSTAGNFHYLSCIDTYTRLLDLFTQLYGHYFDATNTQMKIRVTASIFYKCMNLVDLWLKNKPFNENKYVNTAYFFEQMFIFNEKSNNN